MQNSQLMPGSNPSPPSSQKPSPPPNPPQIKGPCPEDYRDVALHRIADEIGRLADATVLLARATAGEFEEMELTEEGEQYLDGTPK